MVGSSGESTTVQKTVLGGAAASLIVEVDASDGTIKQVLRGQ